MPASVSSPATTHPRLMLLYGLPGAGKTTFARRLEAALPVVRLCPDEWMADLGIDLGDNPIRDRLEARLTRLALELLGRGQSVVLEYGAWRRSERDQMRAKAKALGVPIDLYYLKPPLDELWRRLAERGKHGARDAITISRATLEQWALEIEPPDAAELALFDHAAAVADPRTFPI